MGKCHDCWWKVLGNPKKYGLARYVNNNYNLNVLIFMSFNFIRLSPEELIAKIVVSVSCGGNILVSTNFIYLHATESILNCESNLFHVSGEYWTNKGNDKLQNKKVE